MEGQELAHLYLSKWGEYRARIEDGGRGHASRSSLCGLYQRARFDDRVIKVDGLVLGMPEADRQVITLYYMGQRSARKVAEKIGRSQSYVRTTLLDAKRRVATVLTGSRF